jgi:hypothetical protein
MELRISFDNATDRDRNIYVTELMEFIKIAAPSVRFERSKEHPGSMDLGTVLSILSCIEERG